MQHRTPTLQQRGPGEQHRSGTTRFAGFSSSTPDPVGDHGARMRRARAPVLLLACGFILVIAGTAAVGVVTPSASSAPLRAKLIASDSFHRTVVSGLGRADVGGAYRLLRPYNVAVHVAQRHASIAALAPGQSVAAELPSVSASDVMIKASVMVPRLPSRYPGLYFGVEMRKQPDGRAYRAKLGIGLDGRITIGLSRLGVHRAERDLATRTLPLRIRSGRIVNLEGSVRGSSPPALAVRAWRAGAPVPNWQLRHQDAFTELVPESGDVAEWAYLSQAGHLSSVEQTRLRVWALPARGHKHPKPSSTTSSATSSPPPPNILFQQDYDSLAISDPVAVGTERIALGDPTLNLGSWNVARTSILAVSGRGHVMRITMPRNTISEASGVVIDANLLQSINVASIQYDIRFNSSFDWSKGGKLPGLGGAEGTTSPSVAGGCNAGNSGAWSGRGMWITPSSYPSVTGINELVDYMYDYHKVNACGDNLPTGKALTAGTWHTIKQYYKLNSLRADGTPNADGVVKMWLDGSLVRDTENFLYRNNTGLHINYLYWEIFRGGGDSTWASPTEGTIDFDNLVISSP